MKYHITASTKNSNIIHITAYGFLVDEVKTKYTLLEYSQSVAHFIYSCALVVVFEHCESVSIQTPLIGKTIYFRAHREIDLLLVYDN